MVEYLNYPSMEYPTPIMDQKSSRISNSLRHPFFFHKFYGRKEVTFQRKLLEVQDSCDTLFSHTNTTARQDNIEVIIRKDMVSLCLITQQFQTNWGDMMLLNVIFYKHTGSTGLPYGALIPKTLYTTEVDTMGEFVDLIYSKINHSPLISMRVHIF